MPEVGTYYGGSGRSKSNGGGSMYRSAYQVMARCRTPGGRKKAIETMKKNGNGAFAGVCEKVLYNNPHWLLNKGSKEYETARNATFRRKEQKKNGEIARIGSGQR